MITIIVAVVFVLKVQINDACFNNNNKMIEPYVIICVVTHWSLFCRQKTKKPRDAHLESKNL